VPDESPALSLRPVREDELDHFDRWVGRDADPFNFFGFDTGSSLRHEFQESGLVSDLAGTLLVILDEQVIGDVGWHAQPYGPPGAGRAMTINIRLLPEHRGRGHGGAAQRLLADYLLATYPVNRIEAITDVDNQPEQGALEKAGFTREGVLRGAQWRSGRWHDLVVYSRLRSDPAPS
jgi:RimJ/RimL family protein N-acetyltransferase